MTCSEHTPAEQLLKELPPAPGDIRQLILSHCKVYMIIDKKGSGTAICTSCETEFELYTTPQWDEPVEEIYTGYFPYKHNGDGRCPECGRDVTVKSVGMGRKSLKERHRVLIPVMKDNTLYMSFTEVLIDFRKWSPTLYKWMSAIYKVNDNELTYYKHHPDSCYDSEYWELRKNFKMPALPAIYGPCNWQWQDYMYQFADISSCCKQLKYIDTITMAKECRWDPELFVGFIREVYRYPATEMLYKAGFKNLVYQRASGYTTACMNIRGKKLPKIFRSDMETVRDLREMNADRKETAEYLNILKKYQCRFKDAKDLDKATQIDRRTAEISANLSGPELKRAVEYIKENDIWCYDWVDYLRQLITLDMKLNCKNMFPKDFGARHTALSEQIKIKKNEKLREAMKRMVVEKAGDTVKINGLLFIPATTPEELQNEGEQQHHCVAMYAERVARGNCFIYMVRKESEPDKSFVTMELSPKGDIRQLRGFANCNPDEEVTAAANKFAEEFKKEKKTA